MGVTKRILYDAEGRRVYMKDLREEFERIYINATNIPLNLYMPENRVGEIELMACLRAYLMVHQAHTWAMYLKDPQFYDWIRCLSKQDRLHYKRSLWEFVKIYALDYIQYYKDLAKHE